MFSSCELLKDIEYTVTPNPLEMHCDSVEVNITATIPEKGMHKKAVAEITPVFGDQELKKVVYQGEKAAGNGKVIPYKAGGRISYTDKVAYKDAFENAELHVKIHATKGKKEKDYNTEEPIAHGTIITPALVQCDAKVIHAKDQFVRVTQHDQFAQINYEKNKSNVRYTELKDSDMVAMDEFIGEAVANDRIDIKNVQIDAWASPEGELSFNSELAEERANTAMAQMQKYAKGKEWEAGTAEDTYSKSPKGEDWDGFKREMEKSDIEDKELILRILSQYEGEKREEEIRNLSQTYKVIEKKILPQLRRSEITVNYDLTGKTDEELLELSKSKPDSLTIEEILFTATLVNDLGEKLRIYKEAQKNYGDDWRSHNNVGYILFLQGDVDGAMANFEKAAEIDENGTVKNNLAASHMCKTGVCGPDKEKALALLEEASGAGSEVDYNMGSIFICNCRYAEAAEKMGSSNSFNKALAQVLNGDTSGALTTIDESEDKETAMGYYLKAIIGARTNNQDMLINNLKSAIGKDASLKAKAAKDMEFHKWMENEAFKAVVN